MRAASCSCAPTDTWPGARTPAPSWTSCAAPATALVSPSWPARKSATMPLPTPTTRCEEEGHEPGHPRALLRGTRPVELFSRLGAAGTGDVAGAPAQVQAGGLALRGR